MFEVSLFYNKPEYFVKVFAINKKFRFHSLLYKAFLYLIEMPIFLLKFVNYFLLHVCYVIMWK